MDIQFRLGTVDDAGMIVGLINELASEVLLLCNIYGTIVNAFILYRPEPFNFF